MLLVIIGLRPALAEDSQKITSIIKETQKLTTESGSLVLAWWIPYQYWEESAKANAAINDIMKQDLLKAVQDYTVIGVVDAKKEGLGLSFTPAEEILKTAKICPKCGEHLPGSYKFCPYDGTNLQAD